MSSERPLWGSKWSGAYRSPWTYTSTAQRTRKISEAPTTYRTAMGNCEFLYESAIRLVLSSSNPKASVNACRELFKHSLSSEKQENAETTMLALPEVSDKWHVVTLSDIEVLTPKEQPLVDAELPSQLRAVFVAVAVLFEKESIHGTLYRSVEIPVRELSETSIVVDNLKVAISPKDCTLILQLWGTNVNNTHTLLSTTKITTKKLRGDQRCVCEGPVLPCLLKFGTHTEKVDIAKAKEFARTLYRHLLLEIAVSSFDRELDDKANTHTIVTQWSGNYHPSYNFIREVFTSQLRSSSWLELRPWQEALDHFCVVSHMDKKLGVSTAGCLRGLENVLEPFQLDGEAVSCSISDKTRMCEAVDSLLMRCLGRITQPFISFDVALLGSTHAVAVEVSSCIRIVKLVYNFEPWHTHTAAAHREETLLRSTNDVAILTAARKYVTNHHMSADSGYSRDEMKDELVSQFGQNDFFRYKPEIDQMCEQSVRKTKLVSAVGTGKKGALISRLAKLLEGGDTTLSAVTDMLVQEFGKKAVAKQRQKINEMILQEMNSRRRGRTSGRRRLERDLILQLEAHLKKRYAAFIHECKPEKSFEGDEIVHLMLIVMRIEANMHHCDHMFTKLYIGIDGFILSNSVFEIYGRLLAQDLRLLLKKWSPQNGHDLAAVLFELYFAIRKLVESMRPKLPKPQVLENDLFKYLDWFEPFVVYWMRLSQRHAFDCITRSVDSDNLTPITTTDLYSASVLDVFKLLFEMVRFYKDLKWADHNAAQQRLAPVLAQIICRSVGIYVNKFKAKVLVNNDDEDDNHNIINNKDNINNNNNNNNKYNNNKRGSKDFVVSQTLACALNNLDEILSRFREVYATFHDEGHFDIGSPQEKQCEALFTAVKTEIELSRTDILHVIASKIRPRIRADMIYLLYNLPKDDGETVSTHVDNCLGALLDEPDEASLRKGMVSWSKLISSYNLFSSKSNATTTPIPEAPTNDGYLCVNLIAISQHVERGATINRLVACVWGQVLQALRDLICSIYHPLPKSLQMPESPFITDATFEYQQVFPRKASMGADFQAAFATAIEAVIEHFVLFFNDDGDGVPHSVLFERSEKIASHVLLCCQMTTSALIIEFLVKASTPCASRLRRLEAVARGALKKKQLPQTPSKEDVNNNTINSLSSDVETTQSFAVFDPVVEAQRTGIRKSAIPTSGSVLLKLRFDHARKCAIVSVIGIHGLPKNECYFKVRLLPRFNNSEPVKLRSDKKTGMRDDEVFIIPIDMSTSTSSSSNANANSNANTNVNSKAKAKANRGGAGVVIQFRVQSKSLLQKQSDTVIGEVMICVQTLERTTRELKLKMPLHPIKQYSGAAGEALQLLRDRSQHDLEAKDFISMYGLSD